MHRNKNDAPQTNSKFSVRFQRPWIHSLIWVTLVLYLAIVNPIYLSRLHSVERVDHQWLDALAETRMHQSIDVLRLVRHDNQEMYRIDGWAFPQNSNPSLDQFQKQVILLDDEGSAFLLNAINVTRPDVDEHYAYPNREVEESGFAFFISKYSLARGIYQVGILYTTPSTPPEYMRTQSYIERTPNTLVLHRSQPEFPTSWFEKIVAKAKPIVKDELLAIDPSGELLMQVRKFLGFVDRAE